MKVSIAPGILVSELSDDPWKGKLIKFSANLELQMVEGNSLSEKSQFVSNMEWGVEVMTSMRLNYNFFHLCTWVSISTQVEFISSCVHLLSF